MRLREVKHRTGLSRSSIYAKMASASFPHSIKLGVRMVAWYESQVDDWIVNPQ